MLKYLIALIFRNSTYGARAVLSSFNGAESFRLGMSGLSRSTTVSKAVCMAVAVVSGVNGVVVVQDLRSSSMRLDRRAQMLAFDLFLRRASVVCTSFFSRFS